MERIILFDGECNLCDKSVQFIIKRDPEGTFKFASLQSDVGKKLLKKYDAPLEMDSFVLIDKNNCYFKSSAALSVCQHLNGFWKIMVILLIVPKPIRDFCYEIIAKNRYKWFGKKDHCMIPTPEVRNRFIRNS